MLVDLFSKARACLISRCYFSQSVESISLWRDVLVTGSGDGTVAVWRLSQVEKDDDPALAAQQQQQRHQNLPPQQQRQNPLPQQPQQPIAAPPMRLRLRHNYDADDEEAKELVLSLTYRTKSYLTDVSWS